MFNTCVALDMRTKRRVFDTDSIESETVSMCVAPERGADRKHHALLLSACPCAGDEGEVHREYGE